MSTEKSDQILFLMKMATKLRPQGRTFKRFEFWTKVAKVTKPQRTILALYSILSLEGTFC
ncbi:hypothetical protein HanIR_Chr13g0637961 [Helianthus annuus]|nr:hypothetical protein HanIR_Chr13g0637961 [Helianthus annuus]